MLNQKCLMLALVVCLFTILCSCETNEVDVCSEMLPRELPILSIQTEENENVTDNEEYVDGSVHVRIEGNCNEEVSEVKIRTRGNSTLIPDKKAYQIKFPDKTGVLGMPENKRWVLLANYFDKTMLRNEVGFEFGRISDMDWTPQSKFIELKLNNEYLGTYLITQKVEEGTHRVNIGDEGFLLEVVPEERLEDDEVTIETERFTVVVKEPNINAGGIQYQYIQDYLSQMEAALYGEDFMDDQLGYANYLDVESCVDWYLINEIAKNTDAAFHASVFMYLIPGEKLKMGPVWDFDLSFGNVNYNDNFIPEGFWMKDARWIKRLFEDPEFVDKVKSRYEFFYSNKANMINMINSNASLINSSQDENYEKWETLGELIWPNPVSFDTFEEEVDYLSDWIDKRMEWLNEEIENL